MPHLPRPVIEPTAIGRLADLANGQLIAVGDSVATGLGAVSVTGIELDSRKVMPGDLFAALPGHGTHGARFATQAAERGAAGVLTDDDGLRLLLEQGVRLPAVVVARPRDVLGALSASVFGNDPAGMALLGVTGTNGKTTVVAMLDAGLRAAGHRTGVIGTTGVRIADDTYPGERTTPEAPHVHALIAAMRERQVSAMSMEVSSIAMREGRIDGLHFDVAGFTNLSVDHLDYHGTIEEYFEAKAALFSPERAHRAVVCIDDEWGRRLAARIHETHSLPPRTVSATGLDADWRVNDQGEVSGPDGLRLTLDVAMPGAFNRANAILALAMLDAIGVSADIAAVGIGTATVPGRMERIDHGGVRGIVDYAHTPDAIERVLGALRGSGDGHLIVVLGAGGDRDRGKRAQMGEIAARLADTVIVTDDNPRSEKPEAIRAAVLQGAQSAGGAGAVEIGDRAAAIHHAAAMARPGDTVAVLGKGHETGQEIAGVIVPFDDRAVLGAALRETDR